MLIFFGIMWIAFAVAFLTSGENPIFVVVWSIPGLVCLFIGIASKIRERNIVIYGEEMSVRLIDIELTPYRINKRHYLVFKCEIMGDIVRVKTEYPEHSGILVEPGDCFYVLKYKNKYYYRPQITNRRTMNDR